MKSYIKLVFILVILTIINSCEEPTAPQVEGGVFSGEITNNITNQIVYIIEGDSLLSIVRNNLYSIELGPGEHEIIFSAIGYLDEIVSVTINGNYTEEIVLNENSEQGRVYGEFQNLVKLQKKITENNEIADWSEEQIYDGVTGATILEDNSNTDFQHSELFIGDSLVGYADVYGQYWIKIQRGTYPLTGKTVGFSSETEIVKITLDSRIYKNYYLTPQ